MQDDLAAAEVTNRPRPAVGDVRQRERGKRPSDFEGACWLSGWLFKTHECGTCGQRRRGREEHLRPPQARPFAHPCSQSPDHDANSSTIADPLYPRRWPRGGETLTESAIQLECRRLVATGLRFVQRKRREVSMLRVVNIDRSQENVTQRATRFNV